MLDIQDLLVLCMYVIISSIWNCALPPLTFVFLPIYFSYRHNWKIEVTDFENWVTHGN